MVPLIIMVMLRMKRIILVQEKRNEKRYPSIKKRIGGRGAAGCEICFSFVSYVETSFLNPTGI